MKNDLERCQQGYESRHIAWALWVQSIIAFSESEDDVFMAGVNATLACAFDPLPVVEVGLLLSV